MMERRYVGGRAHGIVNSGALPFSELQFDAHSLQGEKNIGKDNRGVEFVRPDGLKRYFSGNLRRLEFRDSN
jgi:hypothetical protein